MGHDRYRGAQVHASHIVMASAPYAVAAHSHAYESRQPSSTTSYPVREYAGIGHDPQRLTLLNKGPGLPGLSRHR